MLGGAAGGWGLRVWSPKESAQRAPLAGLSSPVHQRHLQPETHQGQQGGGSQRLTWSCISSSENKLYLYKVRLEWPSRLGGGLGRDAAGPGEMSPASRGVPALLGVSSNPGGDSPGGL